MEKIPKFRFMGDLKAYINKALEAAAMGNHELAALYADHIINTAQRMALYMGKDTLIQFTSKAAGFESLSRAEEIAELRASEMDATG